MDRTLLYATLKEVLANQDGLIRGLAAPIYPLLSAEDAKALLPEIVAATRRNAPSGEMFRYGIRWAGLNLLARFRIREGMGICVDMMNELEWGRDQNQCTHAFEAVWCGRERGDPAAPGDHPRIAESNRSRTVERQYLEQGHPRH